MRYSALSLTVSHMSQVNVLSCLSSLHCSSGPIPHPSPGHRKFLLDSNPCGSLNIEYATRRILLCRGLVFSAWSTFQAPS